MGRNQYADLGAEHGRPEAAEEDDQSPRTGQEWARKLGYVDRVNNSDAFNTDGPVTQEESAQLAGDITMLRDDDPQVQELRRRRLASESEQK